MGGKELRLNLDAISGAVRLAILNPEKLSTDAGGEYMHHAHYEGFGLNQSRVLS